MRRIRLAPIVLLLASCGTDPAPAPDDLSDPTVPETWVRSEWSPAWWTVIADVKEFVPEDRWTAIDTSWMAAKAAADLEKWGPKNQNPSEQMFSGLWRLGLERDGVLAAIAELDGAPAWPLDPATRVVAWQPRMERWLRAHSMEELAAELASTWRAAVASRHIQTAGRVVQAYELLGDREAIEPLASEAQDLIRRALAELPENYHIDAGLLVLLERFGVPEGVDLEPVLAAVRRRYHELEDATVPLPTPYDLHLACLRLHRLLAD